MRENRKVYLFAGKMASFLNILVSIVPNSLALENIVVWNLGKVSFKCIFEIPINFQISKMI